MFLVKCIFYLFQHICIMIDNFSLSCLMSKLYSQVNQIPHVYAVYIFVDRQTKNLKSVSSPTNGWVSQIKTITSCHFSLWLQFHPFCLRLEINQKSKEAKKSKGKMLLCNKSLLANMRKSRQLESQAPFFTLS